MRSEDGNDPVPLLANSGAAYVYHPWEDFDVRFGILDEDSFAHMYETEAMRRLHLRQHDNILKRLLIHAVGFNLSL